MEGYERCLVFSPLERWKLHPQGKADTHDTLVPISADSREISLFESLIIFLTVHLGKTPY